MSVPFLSELRIMSFNFAPKGWAMCNGQLLPINQNQALFSLLGTTYGGDGRVNFALPDLRGRVPFHVGNGFTLGERGGEEAHTISQSELPSHTHTPAGNTGAPNVGSAAGAFWCDLGGNSYSNNNPPNAAMINGSILPTGGSQPHTNISPYLVLTVCIALQGIFPSQT
jgi:microcystin-dependent protein